MMCEFAPQPGVFLFVLFLFLFVFFFFNLVQQQFHNPQIQHRIQRQGQGCTDHSMCHKSDQWRSETLTCQKSATV